MKILLIHTCGLEGTIALADTASDHKVQRNMTLPPRTFSEGLMPAIRSILQDAGWAAGDLEAVGVVSGPGSFTGVRTGLSVGKGLSEALDIPLVGVSRLALLSHTASGNLIHAVLDAGRGEFYCGSYWQGIRERESVFGREALLQAIGYSGSVVLCEEKVAAELKELKFQLVPEPGAGQALNLVLEALSQPNDNLTEANYLRQTDGDIFTKPIVGKVSSGSNK